MKTNKKVLTIGGATQDLFIHYDNPEIFQMEKDHIIRTCLLLEQGSKLDIKEISYYTGGGATNSGASFARLGFDTSAFFKIAKDPQGKFILNDLKKEKLKTKFVYADKIQTAMSFILPTPSGDRIILAFRGANRELHINEIPFQIIKKSHQIYITSLSGNSSTLLLPITEFAKKNNIHVAVNPGLSQLKEDKVNELMSSLKYIDTFILNKKEAQELMNSISPATKFSIENYFKIILSMGPSIVVITNGSHGVYVGNKEKIHFQKSISSKTISTLGAGDAFGSCFVASLLDKKTIEEAALYGAINAWSVIQHEGAKTGLLTWKEIEEKAKNYI